MFFQKLICLIFVLLTVIACGKKGDPGVSEPSPFPRPYPRDFYAEKELPRESVKFN